MNTSGTSDRARQLGSALLIAAFTAAIGYVLASGLTQWWLNHAELDFTYVALHYTEIQTGAPRLFNLINILIIGCFVGGASSSGPGCVREADRLRHNALDDKGRAEEERFLRRPKGRLRPW